MRIKTCQAPGCENEFEANPHNKKYCSITCKNLARYSSEQTNDEYDVEDEEDVDDPSVSYSPPSTHSSGADEENKLYARNSFLSRENVRLQRANEKYKQSSSEAYGLILKAVKENVKAINTSPKIRATSSKQGARELVLNPWNSDTQIGKVTPTYNTNVAHERVALYTDKIIERTIDFSSAYSITTANIWFLGDVVEGENIFPTQSHVIDTSVFRQSTVDAPTMYVDQILRLLEYVEIVNVICVIGNHGRLGRYSNPESNMDRVFYQILYWMFKDNPRVNVVVPQGHGESMFWAVDKIGNYSTLLVHGDQFGPPSTQNSYVKKIPNWKISGIPVHFDDVAMGHYHQNTKFTIGDTVVRIAGSTESHNTFAQERLGVMGRASQHLQFIDPAAGVFYESDVYLD